MPQPSPQPLFRPTEKVDRTIEDIKSEMDHLEGFVRESTEDFECDEGQNPSPSDISSINEVFTDEEIGTKENYVILVRAQLKILTEQYESVKKEIQELEDGILNMTVLFNGLSAQIEEALKQIDEYRANKKPTIDDQKNLLFNDGKIKKAEREYERLRGNFELMVSQLRSRSRTSEVLKNNEVIRLKVLFQKTRKFEK